MEESDPRQVSGYVTVRAVDVLGYWQSLEPADTKPWTTPQYDAALKRAESFMRRCSTDEASPDEMRALSAIMARRLRGR